MAHIYISVNLASIYQLHYGNGWNPIGSHMYFWPSSFLTNVMLLFLIPLMAFHCFHFSVWHRTSVAHAAGIMIYANQTYKVYTRVSSHFSKSTHTHTDSGDMSPTRTCVPYVLLAIVWGHLWHHQAAMCTMVHKGDYIFWKIRGSQLTDAQSQRMKNWWCQRCPHTIASST